MGPFLCRKAWGPDAQTMPKSYVTVYSKANGSPHFTYAATVKEWLATGEYTLEAPDVVEQPPELIKKKLPTAGREANRDNPIISGGLSEKSLVPATDAEPAAIPEPEAETAPAKPAPRRRVSAEG